MIYPDGREIDYDYHTGGSLKTIHDNGATTTLAAYDYIGSRLLRRDTFDGSHLLLDIAYNSVGRPTDWKYSNSYSPSVELLDFQYGYDRAGNKLYQRSLHDPRDTQRYAYDSASRLSSFVRGDFGTLGSGPIRLDLAYCGASLSSSFLPDMQRARRWTLDGLGNWQETVMADGSPDNVTETRLVNSFNEIYRITSSSLRTRNFLYDDNGNLTEPDQNPDDDIDYYYEWDALGRLARVIQVDIDDEQYDAHAYVYDASNRRARAIKDEDVSLDGEPYEPGSYEPYSDYPWDTTNYYYAGWRTIEERFYDDSVSSESPFATRQFVYGNYIDEVLVLDVNDDPEYDDAVGDTGDTRYLYLQNSLYNVVGLARATTAALSLVEAYQYDPYGRHVALTDGDSDGEVDFDESDSRAPMGASSVGNPFMFTGRRFDSETGLHYFRLRYYDSATGRFISRDPIGIWGDGINMGNGYGYVGGMATGAVDPMGLHWSPNVMHTFIDNMIGVDGEYEEPSGLQATVGLTTEIVIGEVPIIGTGADLYDFKYEWENGTWVSITLSGVAFIPGVGILGKLGKKADDIAGAAKKVSSSTAAKVVKKAPEVKAGNKLDNVAEEVNASARTASARTASERTALARRLGREGEDAAGIVRGAKKKKIDSLTGTAQFRVPDELTETTLREIKNVKYLSNTKQLQDYLLYAQKHNLTFILETRSSTQFSRKLQVLINEGQIVHRIIGE